jgi:DUF971 family protein
MMVGFIADSGSNTWKFGLHIIFQQCESYLTKLTVRQRFSGVKCGFAKLPHRHGRSHHQSPARLKSSCIRNRASWKSSDDKHHFRLLRYLPVHRRRPRRGTGGRGGIAVGKKNVEITAIEPVGAYAVKLVFSDGHIAALFVGLLHDLGLKQDEY